MLDPEILRQKRSWEVHAHEMCGPNDPKTRQKVSRFLQRGVVNCETLYFIDWSEFLNTAFLISQGKARPSAAYDELRTRNHHRMRTYIDGCEGLDCDKCPKGITSQCEHYEELFDDSDFPGDGKW